MEMLIGRVLLLVFLLVWAQAGIAQSETSATPETHALEVISGTGSGSYRPGTIVTVSADPPPAGQEFAGWSGDISILSNPFLATTTALMPSLEVSIASTYADQLTLLSAPEVGASFSLAEGTGTGLRAEYYNDDSTVPYPLANPFAGSPALTRTDATVDFNWSAGSPAFQVTPNFFSAKWTGRLKAPEDAFYTFTVTGDDGVRLFLNGAKVIDGWRDQGATSYSSGQIYLTKGQLYDIELNYYEHEGDASCRLQWRYFRSSEGIVEAIPQSQLYPPTHDIVDLGTLAGSSAAKDINNSGQIVGEAQVAEGITHATLFSGTGADNVDLGTLGGEFSSANAINDLGQIVGYSILPGFLDRATLFRLTGNNIDLGTLGGTSSKANDINNSGQIVGDAANADGVTHATIFSGTGTGNTDIGDAILTDVPSSAAAINNAGQIVGFRENGNRVAMLFGPGGGSLGTLNGGDFSWATAINDAGLIVGVGESIEPPVETHGVIFRGLNNNVDLGVLPEHSGAGAGRTGYSSAADVNNAGMIVGQSGVYGIEQNDQRGVIGSGSGWMRLPINITPAAINDWGQIVGTYRNRATLLNPVDPLTSTTDEVTNIKFVGGMAYERFAGVSESGGLQTDMTFLAGTAGSGGDGPYRKNRDVNVSFAARGNNAIASDIVNLSGTAGNGFADTLVLQMSYDESQANALPGGESQARLGWSNPQTGQWVLAVEGNAGGMPVFAGNRSYAPMTDFVLGRYGVDTTKNIVWAVINHNGSFGVVGDLGQESSGTGLLGQYYNDGSDSPYPLANPFAGPSVLTRTDATVDFSWGADSPGSAVTSNFFSAKWTGRVKAPVSGTYTFTVTGDDGVRLFFDGAKVIDGWRDQGATPYSFRATLTAGALYDIELHYYEHEGNAACRLEWSYPGQTIQAIPQSQLFPTMGETPGTGLRGQYYNDNSSSPYPPDNPFVGSPALTRTDATVDFIWGNGSPGSPVTSNFFSARWAGQVEAPVSGTYTFTVTGDDGVRLFLNGVKVIDAWRDQGATPYSYTTNLTAGVRYDIELHYYEHEGNAVCRLQWSYPGQALQAVPRSHLHPPQTPSSGYELDQENVPNDDLGGLEITRNQTVAQSFAVSKSGKLSRVDIVDIRHHRCSPQESLHISLIDMSGDALGQNTLYMREVYPHEVNGTISLELGSYAPAVSKGDKYAISLKTDADPSGCTYAWGGGFETYDGGDAFINGVKNLRDMKFRTYVTSQ